MALSYPSLEQVEAADKFQLARWVRHLPSGGEAAGNATPYSREAHFEAIDVENKVMEAILRRFNQLGGWTPEISKAVGWD